MAPGRIGARVPPWIAALPPPPLERVVGAADAARRWFLRALGPLARAVVVPREQRVAVVGTIGVLMALAGTWCAPLVLLALGPLLFGVPHLVSDARYLVARPGLHRRRAALVSAAVLIAGLAAGLGVRAGLIAALFVALGSRGTWKRRVLVAAGAGALLGAAQLAPFEADVVFGHAHNLVAIGLWLAWRRREQRKHLVVLASFAAASLAIAFGPVPTLPSSDHWTGLSIPELGDGLSFAPNPDHTHRLVLFFAFAQAVHYVVWLRLIPDEDRRQSTPRSYAQTVRALRGDIGAMGLWLALATSVAIACFALARLSLARDVYLGIAYAHGHVELIAAAFFATEGVRTSSGPG